MMNLYIISQDENDDYDTYDCAVVCAEDEEEARKIHPDGKLEYDDAKEGDKNYGTWCEKAYVKVRYIGIADESIEKGVLVSSFHAG